MPYISELLNNKITDSSDVEVGKLEDILINPQEEAFEPLDFLVIKAKDGSTKFVPYEFVANFNSSQISLKNLFSKIALPQLPAAQNFVYLKKEVLDQQIVDLAGTRVVRVNDLRIGTIDNKMCVLAIDSSFRGLLRRLGFADYFLASLFSVNLIDWRKAKLLKGSSQVQLNSVAEELSELHPADLANIVEDLDVKFGSNLLASLDSTRAAKVLEEVDPKIQTILIKYLGPQRAGKILNQMSSDEFVDLIKTFSEPEARDYLSNVGTGRAQSVAKLISYPDNTAGGFMTLDFFSARPSWSVEKTIEEIRKISHHLRSIVHIYVSEEDGKFRGVVSMRRLLLADRNILMQKLAKDFPLHSTLKPHDKIQKIIKLMTKYNLYTAAVIDKDKKIVGVVTIDDIMRQLAPSS